MLDLNGATAVLLITEQHRATRRHESAGRRMM
jgi:hypothetical protein